MTDFTTWTSAEAIAVLTEIEARVQPTGAEDDITICDGDEGCAAEVCALAASIRDVISRARGAR